jgi:hypothetical protein
MTPEQIAELEQRIQELEREVSDRNSQQIQVPLDPASVVVIAKALQDAGYIIT